MSDRGPSSEEPLAFLFMVRAGSTHSLEDFEPICGLLSRKFRGEIWSYGSYEADIEIGRMRVRVFKECTSRRLVNFARFARAVLGRARELREAPLGRVVVTSYDPCKGGLLALLASRLLKAAFLCEVNGVYGNPENYSHLHFGPWRWLRQLQVRMLGTFVLRRANAVRLLFPNQLENFVTLTNGTVVRHFFDLAFTDCFYPGSEEPIILAAGFPFMVKGVDVLVAAFNRIALRYPKWKLVLIGHLIPAELRARQLEHPQIQALPGMPRRELAQWMSRCSILVLASRTEGIPRILLEAAAAAKCRIAARIGGIPTVVEHGVDGLLFEKENVSELAENLERAIQEEDFRHRLGVTAQQRIAKEFSASVYLARFTELISAMLAAGEVARPTSCTGADHGI